MKVSWGKPERLPLLAGLLTSAAGLAMACNPSSPLMMVLGVTLVLAGVVMCLGALVKQDSADIGPWPEPAAAPEAPGQPVPDRAVVTRSADEAFAELSAAPGEAQAPPPPLAGEWLTRCMQDLTQSFNAWVEQRDAGESLWPGFDRWVRDALHQNLRARRVRCFRTNGSAHQLVSLTSEVEEPLWSTGDLPGLVEHVLATGRAYVKGDRNNGDSVERLAGAWGSQLHRAAGVNVSAPQWLLPVRQRGKTIGLILAGELPGELLSDVAGLTATGTLLCTFWRYAAQSEALVVAEKTDQSSGVLNRADLTAQAEKLVREAGAEGEPIVLISLAVEGVRRLNDLGHWELRDHLMREIGSIMQRKMRSDDLIGRFSEDRFVAVMRRLDLPLGEIISRKLLGAVQAAAHQDPALEEIVRIRCGLTDAGSDGFEAAVGRAFQALNHARREDRDQPLALSRRDAEQPAVAAGETA